MTFSKDDGETTVHRGPLSYASDGDTTTSFVTDGHPAGLMDNDGVVVDLMDRHLIALIVIWQNETLACSMCMIQKSLNGEDWDDIQLMVHTDGMVVAGFGPDANIVARYIRLAVVEPMEHAWEIVIDELDLEMGGDAVPYATRAAAADLRVGVARGSARKIKNKK